MAIVGRAADVSAFFGDGVDCPVGMVVNQGEGVFDAELVDVVAGGHPGEAVDKVDDLCARKARAVGDVVAIEGGVAEN